MCMKMCVLGCVGSGVPGREVEWISQPQENKSSNLPINLIFIDAWELALFADSLLKWNKLDAHFQIFKWFLTWVFLCCFCIFIIVLMHFVFCLHFFLKWFSCAFKFLCIIVFSWWENIKSSYHCIYMLAFHVLKFVGIGVIISEW